MFAESTKVISPHLSAEELPNSPQIPRQSNENQPDQVVERVKWVNTKYFFFVTIIMFYMSLH